MVRARKMASALGEIVLMAPDVDRSGFENVEAQFATKAGHRTSLYVSDRDCALKVSKAIRDEVRLGDAADGVPVVLGVETIDASDLAAEDGHYAVGSSAVGLRDLSLLLAGAEPPRDALEEGPGYWVFADP